MFSSLVVLTSMKVASLLLGVINFPERVEIWNVIQKGLIEEAAMKSLG
jgi:hypothetical protein